MQSRMSTPTVSDVCVLQRRRTFDPEENNIIKACKIGSFETAIDLATGREENITDSNGWTLLHYACEHCQLKYISKLLELGCSPLHRDFQGTTPLHIACKYGLLESVRKFTNWPGYGSSSLTDNKGYSPLHVACEYGQLDIVKLLISSGCDSTLCTEDGQSPLQIAVHQGEMDIVLLLGNYGCNLRKDLAKKEQLFLFYKACKTGHTLVVTQLIQSGLISSDNFTAMFKQSALHLACRYGHGGVMHELISAGHDPESVDEDGCTALHIACKFGQAEIVKELTIVYHCNPFLKNSLYGVSPLDLAYRFNHHSVVNAILTTTNTSISGELHPENIPPVVISKPDIQNSPRVSLMLETTERDLPFVDIATIRKEHLFMACKHGDIMAVKALIEDHNCDPTLPLNVDGQNPLHIACGYGHTEIVQYLLQVQNCDPTVKTSSGDTPFHFATNPLYVMGAEQVCYQVEILKALGQRFFYEHYGDSKSNTLYGSTNVKTLASSNRSTQRRVRRNAETVKRNKEIPFDPNAKNCMGMNPLHYASRNGLIDSVRILVYNLGCDLTCNGRDGNTPLHFACLSGHLETVSFLMEFAPRVCTPVCKNCDKDTPLHFASASGEKDLVAFLIEQKGAKHLPSNAYGDTPLHEACRCGSLDIVRYLLEERKRQYLFQKPLSIANVLGDKPLHVACCKPGNLQLIEYLVERKQCSLSMKNKDGDTPLHKACEFGDLDIVMYLIDKLEQRKVRKICNKRGDTPLHTACTAGQSDVVEYLLSLQVWHPNISNSNGHTPLHLACIAPSQRVVDLILHESATDPSLKDNSGHTPLMLSSSVDVTKLLLAHEVHKADISEVYMKNNPIISDQHPGTTMDSSLNIFILGNQGVGKSTLIQCLQHHESLKSIPFLKLFQSVSTSTVDSGTIGIVPLKFISKYYGCVTLYDFAGHHEYYSSHSAILQNNQSCPSLFVLVLKLNEELDSIKHKLLYWLVFIRNQCCKALPQLVVVGSHCDQIHSSQYTRVQAVIEELKQSHCEEFTSVSYKGFVAADCRKSGSTSIVTLRQTIQGIASVQNSQNSTPMADYLLLYLRSVICSKIPALLLSDLMDYIQSDEQWFNVSDFEPNSDVVLLLSSDESIAHLCKELHQRGHLLFLSSKNTLSKSCIILDSQVLLSEVVGKVFVPQSISQYRCLSSTTGVIPLSKIKVMFPDLNPDMITRFLSFLEFCHEASDVMVLKFLFQDSSCRSTFSEMKGVESERYFFFPGLVCTCTPKDLWIADSQFKYHSGWMLQCIKPGHFFSSRFLHVLVLRLTFSFALPVHSDELTEAEMSSPMLQRKCKVWKNGISWTNRNGVEAVVEVTQQGTVVSVFVRCLEGSEVYCIGLRSSIIKYVHSAVREFCPIVATSEHLLHPSELLSHPLLTSTPTAVKFSMTEIAQAICKGSNCVLSKLGKPLQLTKLLYYEPYTILGIKVLQHLLFASANQQLDAEVTDELLCNIAENCSAYTDIFLQILKISKHDIISQCPMEIQRSVEIDDLLGALYAWKRSTKGTYNCLIKCFDCYSIFASQKELLMKFLPLPEEGAGLVAVFKDGFDINEVDNRELRICDLHEVKKEMVRVIAWFNLGLALGLELHTLQKIEITRRTVDESMTDVLAAWLRQQDQVREKGIPSWRTLVKALSCPTVRCCDIAQSIVSGHRLTQSSSEIMPLELHSL